jgi:endonuclease YncB( thermonuclease family)
MEKICIFWDPTGQNLDSLGAKECLRVTDGDTPVISMSIRMLSIDTPEVHYPGNTNPSKQDAKFKELAVWINKGTAPINDGLAEYLCPKLATGKAGSLQEEQGIQAKDAFNSLIEEKLKLPKGKKRQIFLRSSNEHFDSYGRLLAYLSPKYSTDEIVKLSRAQRATFNLLMIENGWASPFPIFPSLPQYLDLIMLRDSSKNAWDKKLGIWGNKNTLTGYEFRMCVKLYAMTKKLVDGKKLSSKEKFSWIERYCADMITREIFYPQDYWKVNVYNRIFIWPKDVNEATGKMNLVPGI